MKYFTKEWYENCQIYHRSEELEKQIEKSTKDYWEHYDKIEPKLPDCVKYKYVNLHDCKIIDSGFEGKNFYMNIDSSGGFCDVNKLTFVNAEILESDVGSNQKLWWLYDELYFFQDRTDCYERHILFATPNGGLAEMIIVFDDIIIDGNWVEED